MFDVAILVVNFDEELKEEVRRLAEEQHRSMSNLVEKVLREYVDESRKEASKG
ncbi:ribbon-helix-helix domain-containing protein [Halomonas alimentaria]|uniref:Ribbon-helix-helix protein, CopG family n=1 Tax=Halomonas alimentaria TaxID=147248 RepID=A0A7X4W5Z4_9GAMM|nr:ribbon-helix-helix protein, CopG family [Halomonas alimentaria]